MILSVRSQTRKRKLHTIYCTVDGHIEFKCHFAVVNLMALCWHDLNFDMNLYTTLHNLKEKKPLKYENTNFDPNFRFFKFYLIILRVYSTIFLLFLAKN